jgi:putative aldouronate transport system permease protein
MRMTRDRALFMAIGYLLITFAAVFCLFPFLLVIAGSFSSQETILKQGYSLWPRDFSLGAYRLAFLNPEALLRAYGVTSLATASGTALGLFITAMTAYVLTRKNFLWRNRFSFFFYFTTLFSGGLVPWYILCVRYLKLNDSFLALVVPFMLNVFNMLVMKSFMGAIPDAISESARIDGASDFRIFVLIMLPLSKPALATIGLFIALGYWNDWYTSFMFIQNDKLFSLQFYLYKIVSGAEALRRIASVAGIDRVTAPTEPLKLAMTVIATGPIVLLYPFVQRYFISGLTIGAVKG